MKYLIAVFVCLAGPAAARCPDPTLGGVRYEALGPDLIVPQSWEVTARGTYLAPCADWLERDDLPEGLEGYLPVSPTAIFALDGMEPHILMVMAEAVCDPVLAVRTGNGFWYVGEAANGRKEVTIWSAPNAEMQVWVGSTHIDGCEGTVTLETFDH